MINNETAYLRTNSNIENYTEFVPLFKKNDESSGEIEYLDDVVKVTFINIMKFDDVVSGTSLDDIRTLING